MNPTKEFLKNIADEGIVWDDQDLEKLSIFFRYLYEQNKLFNLTSVIDPEKAWMRHFYDSLTLLPFLISMKSKVVLDLGSGGGIPGIPLAIADSSINFTLLDSTLKKCNFLNTACKKINLNNVIICYERAENVGDVNGKFRDKFDAVVSRAVGELSVLLELSIPLIRPGGFLLAIKGEKAQDEISKSSNALKILNAEVIDVHRSKTGRIVVVQKIGPTPRKYPRRPGEPKKEPLN